MSRAVRVADPVHGYILLTALERALIDTRPAQRLRYVGQAGLAHLVFPDLRTSRFIHSLGTMHLASRFLAASLTRAEATTRRQVLDALDGAVREVVGDIGDPGVAASTLDEDGLICGAVVEAADRPTVLLVEQALRLAALFHDLGHLPFSHDFEYALEELGSDPDVRTSSKATHLLRQETGRDALHERIGHALTYVLLRSLFAHEPTEATRVTFELARRILETSEGQAVEKIKAVGGLDSSAEGAFVWLHTLIAGELDVDRCDYVLRDARSYGFEFAGFDLERLIDNLTVVADPSAEHSLVPAVRHQGQGAVESFLIARARMYQAGPRHHKVAQVGAALRYATGELLKPALADTTYAKQHPLRQFIADVEAILSGAGGGDQDALSARFSGYDDQWWLSQLRDAPERDEWFDLVCWRTKNPRSLWKRAMDFPTDIAAWNRRLPDKDDLEGNAAWDDAIRRLRDDGVLVARHRFQPWKSADSNEGDDPRSALNLFDPKHGLTPVSAVSHIVASLREGWMHDVQVHAFARSDCELTGPEVLERLLPTVSGAP